jgi:YHS domain-containing protein
MVTRRGIYLDLSQSPYKITTNGLTFYFSSDLHMLKFEDRLHESRQEIELKLTSRFRVAVKFPALADLTLYMKIETRGFLVINDKGIKLCRENLILNGGTATLKS